MYVLQGIKNVMPAELLTALAFTAVMTASALLGYVTDRRTPKFRKGVPANVAAVAAVSLMSLAMCFIFGASFTLLKGILLADIFMFASVSDIRERKSPDCVPVAIALLGFINVSGSELFRNAAAAFASFGFFFLAAIISRNRIGGADVKFIAACVFVLGEIAGLGGLFIGLLASVIGTLVRNRLTKSKDKTMPMLPYLSAGFLSAFMIGGIIS